MYFADPRNDVLPVQVAGHEDDKPSAEMSGTPKSEPPEESGGRSSPGSESVSDTENEDDEQLELDDTSIAMTAHCATNAGWLEFKNCNQAEVMYCHINYCSHHCCSCQYGCH